MVRFSLQVVQVLLGTLSQTKLSDRPEYQVTH